MKRCRKYFLVRKSEPFCTRMILSASKYGVSGMMAVKFLMNSGIAEVGHVNPLMMNAGDAMTIKTCVALSASGMRMLTKSP